jgi:hypothetical protein
MVTCHDTLAIPMLKFRFSGGRFTPVYKMATKSTDTRTPFRVSVEIQPTSELANRQEQRYIKGTMGRNAIREEVLKYLRNQATPVRMSNMARELREQNPAALGQLRDSDFRHIVQPMIVTGKLSYAPGLKIRIGNATT